MSWSSIALTFCVAFVSFRGNSFAAAQTSNSSCSSEKTCGACIAAAPICRWCADPEFHSMTRCDTEANLQKANCSEAHITNVVSVHNKTKDTAPGDGEVGKEPVQLAPQEIKIKLRPNAPHQFSLVFRQAKNYPVDLYFIMDASNTMKPYKDKLAQVSHELVNQIRNITSNYQLGFGSFVDKPTLPYINTSPELPEVPQCAGCDTPYGFRNQLHLTTDYAEFKSRVQNLNISGNLDAPEGGFDAIMQAVVCKEKIGWREKSNKMILFSTDGSFHYAGDGKLGGIVIPNDGGCHLDRQGLYTKSLEQDYPSISQLAQKVSENKINVIFVVTPQEFDRYRRLSNVIVGSNVGALANDSSNVIALVKSNYDKIRNEIELKEERVEGIKISYSVRCPDNNISNVPKCDKLKLGEEVTFNVTIQITSCPRDPSQWNRTFEIYPVGLTEKLTVHVELMCECGCELPSKEERNSAKCNNSGTYECGICSCNPGFHGSKCECGAQGNGKEGDHSSMLCRRTNTSEECEGRGTCFCDQCNCNQINPNEPTKRYSGKYCECNDYSCNHYKGLMCGGPNRGKCRCGKCECESMYTGDDCGCVNDTSKCRASNGQVCNGKGECRCGECHCTLDTSFKGSTCEDCPTCAGKCEIHRECVLCLSRDTNDPCHTNCSGIDVQRVQSTQDYEESADWKSCQFRDEQNCNHNFVYNYKTNEVKAKEKECPPEPEHWKTIIGVVAGIIFTGILALIIWKVVVTVYDRREYEAFVNEQKNAKWGTTDNPLFTPATNRFQNPTYKEGSS